ncbi:unnamed protein product [Protopolystoma xenopodis]|uniref:Amiloride-sensitive sodium channel n=1 Tax=Protopolystoma xenopodis TaxID=117903 RepID=A0A448WLL5_9PLAT|nr:unnamed protein product [Protopolystoma xenopodis]
MFTELSGGETKQQVREATEMPMSGVEHKRVKPPEAIASPVPSIRPQATGQSGASVTRTECPSPAFPDIPTRRPDMHECTRDGKSVPLKRPVVDERINTASSAFDLFCMSTSVRGMSKLRTGPRFLRTLWLVYVTSMTGLLITASVLMVLDYLNYDVTVHTRVLLDDRSPFPALTVCHHHPFSYEAAHLWRRNQILSPTKFNRYLRQTTLGMLSTADYRLYHFSLMFDTLNIYYQNLVPEDAVRLGHNTSIFWNCMRMVDYADIQFEHDCRLLTGYRIRQFSHPVYLNCHTFEPLTRRDSESITFFSLIVRMGPKESASPAEDHEQAFLPDIFEQAKGLRVAVHEAGSRPDLRKHGLHVEPGKLNEINYEPIRWKKMNTPRRPCLRPNETHQFRDLHVVYNYSQAECIELRKQEKIMANCGCIFMEMPRPKVPHIGLPYCANVMHNFTLDELVRRMGCLANHLMNVSQNSDIREACRPVCDYYDYASTISITKWRAQSWKIYWLRVQNMLLQELATAQAVCSDCRISDSPEFLRYKHYLSRESFSQLPNISELTELSPTGSIDQVIGQPSEQLKLDGDEFAYVVLKRKSDNTVEKYEKLVLSLPVLLSRLGGLCSLSIGLTAAFGVELIEFLYLLLERRRAGRRRKVKSTRRLQPIAEPTVGNTGFREHCNNRVDKGGITSECGDWKRQESDALAADPNSQISKMRSCDINSLLDSRQNLGRILDQCIRRIVSEALVEQRTAIKPYKSAACQTLRDNL